MYSERPPDDADYACDAAGTSPPWGDQGYREVAGNASNATSRKRTRTTCTRRTSREQGADAPRSRHRRFTAWAYRLHRSRRWSSRPYAITCVAPSSIPDDARQLIERYVGRVTVTSQQIKVPVRQFGQALVMTDAEDAGSVAATGLAIPPTRAGPESLHETRLHLPA
jgi:hypothetical protein